MPCGTPWMDTRLPELHHEPSMTLPRTEAVRAILNFLKKIEKICLQHLPLFDKILCVTEQ